MEFLDRTSADGVLERPFRLGVLPGVLWTRDRPAERRAVVLLAHGGGQHKGVPAVVARARHYLKEMDAAVVAIDAPGHGDREREDRDREFVNRLATARRGGVPVGPLLESYNADVGARALPEWSRTLTAVQALDEVGADIGVGFWGLSLGAAVGIPFVAADPRVTAAVFGLVGTGPLVEDAGRLRVPVRFLLQWDDELVDRSAGLAVFDAIPAPEKTLSANTGGHTAVPGFEIEGEARFFARRLLDAPG
ncbi:alpha/beta fold hydrolase [Arthrobacter sp. TMN-37]